ncbi:MAG: hypothetical protein KDH16_23655 [Rhodocyclaceae bacterium]|nr:hypothetical protein [Rhodocyclaceae bacterium]
MTTLAEYKVDEIGSNGLPKSETHGKFVGYVSSTGQKLPRVGQAMAIPQRKASSVTVDMDAVAKMQAEHEERLARMENGGSYWS